VPVVGFTRPAHDPGVSSRVGLWLGVAFVVCFATGLLSHAGQHPPAWFEWPTRPVSLYRITQGVHVLSGVAAIPLLLAKLWSVYPKLFARPVVRSVRHAAERVAVLVLIGAAFFQLATGLLNVFHAYPWRFFFPPAHHAVAWIAIGALAVHVGVELPTIVAALRRRLADDPPPARSVLGRRAFVRVSALAAGAAVLATAGGTVPWLRRVSVLAWTSGTGPQGLPVNRTAAAAGVGVDPRWRLEVVWPGGSRRFDLDELAALPQRTAELPIACVEGWSASAHWTGVPVPALLDAAGAPLGRPVRVESMERAGLYRSSELPPAHAADGLTLLALAVNGERLDLDHGFPARIIAPSRPGVLQTKWVRRLEVV
jgi:hypothetical protein